MQVKDGDMVRFFHSGYNGVILEFNDFNGVLIYVTGVNGVKWKNPTSMSLKMLSRHAEIISESR